MKGPTTQMVRVPISTCRGCEALEERKFKKGVGKYHYYCKVVEEEAPVGTGTRGYICGCSPWSEESPVIVPPRRDCPYKEGSDGTKK